MGRGLRELIAEAPTEEFRGVYIEGPISATRSNVLVPGALGVYSGGSTYNPAQIMRDASVIKSTAQIDDILKTLKNKTYKEFPVETIRKLIELTTPDQSQSERVWSPAAVAGTITQFSSLREQKTGYIYVDRDRGLLANRRETQGILDSGEAGQVPDNKLTVFFLKTAASKDKEAAWWPQIRFPNGQYAFAFAI